MNVFTQGRIARLTPWHGSFLAAAIATVLLPATIHAADNNGQSVVAIEEEWELVIKDPDEITQAPQVTCIIAPSSSGVYAAFSLNHKSFPEYDPGGLHLQLWQGDTPLESDQHQSDALLQTSDEKITWVSRMSLDDGRLWFEVVSGSSETWGDFGHDGTLKVSVATDLEDLGEYNTQDSLASSGVGFAGNRVTSLKLKAVRKTLKSGDVVEDSQVKTLHPQE